MKLTKAEEEIMQILWEIEPCLVTDIIKHMGTPDTPHSTISSIVRILERKGYVDHKAYGRTHEYFSVVKKEDYSKNRLNKFVRDYFDGSPKQLVSFLVREKEIDREELSQYLEEMDDE
ncbi:BlaI/MecI/CopY family transcriptional regulator [Membranicola marinus]|uniref:BlaI/MecI/CopY family transcriptional regulator n=1 Tax=Membranihabitans marinus TaxID=1227546 RepID=A0A953L5J0_9BACT|nr:BlaI/MecI/CopY family transcriptional regulator [Membranihabitans marinus]MBY5956637.1 BlaI/MecI/CopY family transcriptional regulator [Membranihabitans marinus]